MSEKLNLEQVSSGAREKIFEAETTEHFKSTRELFENYARSLHFDLGFQDFAVELKNLPGDYARSARLHSSCDTRRANRRLRRFTQMVRDCM